MVKLTLLIISSLSVIMGCSSSKRSDISSKESPATVDVFKSEDEINYERLQNNKLRLLKLAEGRFYRRVSGIDDLNSVDTDLIKQEVHQKNAAALKIQKKLRLKKTKRDAHNKWVFFSDLEAFDEDDMFRLAVFMAALLSHIHLVEAHLKEEKSKAPLVLVHDQTYLNLLNSPPAEEDAVQTLFADDQTIKSPRSSSSVDLYHTSSSPSAAFSKPRSASEDSDRIKVTRHLSITDILNEKTLMLSPPMKAVIIKQTEEEVEGGGGGGDFNLPSGPITMTEVKAIIDIYKHGGKLSKKSVQKILQLSFQSLKVLPNTTKIYVGKNVRLFVVGDIHGQLPDLLHIIDEFGLPSTTNKIIFNGDFVDRGPCGVEVMCVMLALYIAAPWHVVLNRGNHEDYAVCFCYGFQSECIEKYDETTFGMFVELFHHLPLFATINNDVLVLHGGLFHTRDVRLIELDEIKRSEFTLKNFSSEGESLEAIPRSNRSEYLDQLQRDALWSDPIPKLGFEVSSRGAGVHFGPDVAQDFLKLNNLKMIVRSHECCDTGFEQPYLGNDKDILCTIFSASNYGKRGTNAAAFMIFTIKQEPVEIGDGGGKGAGVGEDTKTSSSFLPLIDIPHLFSVPSSDLIYTVKYFQIDSHAQTSASAFEDGSSPEGGGEDGTKGASSSSIRDLIQRRYQVLITAFERAGKGVICKILILKIYYCKIYMF